MREPRGGPLQAEPKVGRSLSMGTTLSSYINRHLRRRDQLAVEDWRGGKKIGRGSGAMAEVTVFRSWESLFSHRVELALAIKGVKFHRVEEDLYNKSPSLLEYNPVHGKIPVLLHAGKPVVESLVILEYIDETWKQNPLLPAEPYQRAQARFWAKFVDDKCMPTLKMACFTQGKQQEMFMAEAGECLRTLETALQGKRFFGGETLGIVDIAAGFLAHWVGIIQEVAGIRLIEEATLPALCRWIRDFLACEAVKETLPPRDQLLAFFQARKKF